MRVGLPQFLDTLVALVCIKTVPTIELSIGRYMRIYIGDTGRVAGFMKCSSEHVGEVFRSDLVCIKNSSNIQAPMARMSRQCTVCQSEHNHQNQYLLIVNKSYMYSYFYYHLLLT